jgi:hypothetical protein
MCHQVYSIMWFKHADYSSKVVLIMSRILNLRVNLELEES